MKEAVRENLKHSPYTEDFRPGGMGEGGDGVTIVRLRS
jgi:dsDNA-specific endonuclease/ATPase MutS2